MAETQFTSVITDEAMQKINYTQGWLLQPSQFVVMDYDILHNYEESEIFDTHGNMKIDCIHELQNFTTADFNMIPNENKWCQSQFSSLESPTDNTILHHIIIPGNWQIDTDSKEVKTIVFLYTPATSTEPFVYAVARSNNFIVYEPGVTQSYFFSFTVTNSTAQNVTDFIVNYTYPQEIADHNTPGTDNDYNGVHDFLMDRAGRRSITGPFVYTNDVKKCEASDFPQLGLVTKQYVNNLFEELLRRVEEEVCPPGTMRWYPGTPKQFMESAMGRNGNWIVRDGRLLSVSANPKLYALFDNGTRYKSEYLTTHGSYNTSTYFPIMDDRSLYIRGCEWEYNITSGSNDTRTTTGAGTANTNLLSGVSFGGKQNCGLPDHKHTLNVNWTSTGEDAHWNSYPIRFNDGDYAWRTITPPDTTYASANNSLYGSSTEVRTVNRNYTPIIRIG